MILRERLRNLSTSDMLRDVLRLVSGSLGGRLILLAAMPLVTRLYSPDDFALLAVYMAAVTMGGAIACLRFDIAIPVANDDKDASHLLVLGLLIAGSFTSLLLIAIWAAPQAIADLLGQPHLRPWLWMIPLGILMTASYSALQFWTTRTRRFSSIAITRITQAATGAATMLSLGWFGITPLGLLLGHMLSGSAGSLRLGREALRDGRGILRQVTRSGLMTTFRNYRRFPIYSTPEAFANIAGLQVSIMIVAAHAGAEAGYLLLAQQVMAAPMTLLGSSIAQVYVSRAPEEMREGRLASFTLGILRRLVQIGVGPLIFGALLAPLVFPFIFGSQWARAGEIMIWMLPWTALQFLSSPISMALYVIGQQKVSFLIQIFGIIVRIGMVLLSPIFFNGEYIISFIAGSTAFYIIYLLVLLYYSYIYKSKSNIISLSKSVYYVIPWVIFAILLIFLFKVSNTLID